MNHGILTDTKLNFKCTTHDLYIYPGTVYGVPIFLLCQVDAFFVGGAPQR